MRRTKKIGFAYVVVAVAMAAIGAHSAGAETTSLCKLHEVPCAVKNQKSSLHLVAINPLILFNSVFGTISILCKESLASFEVGALGAPQKLTFSSKGLTWTTCEHEGEKCEVNSPKLGFLSLLRTSLNLGSAEFHKTEIQVKCQSIVLDCTYAGEQGGFLAEGALHSKDALNGEFVANKVPFALVAGGASCLEVLYLDARYRASEHFFIVS